MKAWKLSLYLAVAMVVVFAGSKTAFSDESPRRGIEGPRRSSESCDAELESALRIPPGTETWYEGKQLRFKLPVGYVAWSRGGDGTYLALDEAGVECSCAGGGCDPISQGGEIYCAIKPACSSGCCKRSTKASLAVIVTEAFGTVRRATPDEVKSLPLAPPELVDIPEIAEAVKTYINRVYAGREPASLETKGNRAWAPKGYVLVHVNVYGYLANALVPANAKCELETLVSGVSGKCEDGGDAAAKCRCNSGSGCTYWSKPWPISVSGCDSGSCSACEML